MGIFSRFADIINSNINALLDKAEDPEKLIRLIIQEMEDTLVEVRTSSARAIADKKEVQRNIEWLKQEEAEWQSKAVLAIEKQREDLAKAALVEANKAQEKINGLEKELKSIEGVLTKLSTEVSQLQDKLEDAKSRQNAIILRQKTSRSRLKIKKQIYSNQSDEALSKFEQFERKLDDIDAEIESYDLGKKSSLADEINNLANQDKIDEQLAKLKARINKQQTSDDN